MTPEKLVDSDFLSKLVAGSMETAMAAVDEAVMSNAGLFGGEADTVATIGTYEDHVIVANKDGDFFRARWKRGEGWGDSSLGVTLSEVEAIDVPVYEAGAMGSQARQEARDAVDALMGDDMDRATEKIRGLYGLVKSGVRLTAEGVEDLYAKQGFHEHDWFSAVREQNKEIRAFLGTEALRVEADRARFADVEGVTESQAEPKRGAIVEALGQLTGKLVSMRNRIALAKQISADHEIRDSGAGGMAASDFVEFVAGYGEDLENLIGILGDAQVVAEDGSLKCLARLHDGIAENVYEWGLAAAFCEKLARRFVVAQED